MRERLIVLRTFKHGESDLVVQVLNREGSKFSLFARGAMKSRKRFGGGVLEPTHYIEADYKPSTREDSMGVLKEATLLESFDRLRMSYPRLELALHFVHLVDRISREGAPDSHHLFDLLGNALRAAEHTDHLDWLRLQFEVKLLSYQGVLRETEPLKPFIALSLRDHDQLDLSPAAFQTTNRSIQEALQYYLHH